MSYPWPSLGTFIFARDERAIYDTDSGWNIDPTYSRSRPLGSATTSTVMMSMGSSTRSFECNLSPARFAALQALVGLTADFTDFDPDPDHRQALLARITQLSTGPVACSDGTTKLRVRTKVELESA